MKKVILLITGIILFSVNSYCQNAPTVYDQLCTLNSQWLTNKTDHSVLDERILLATDQELIKMHLTLVEHTLRNKNVSHLSEKQKANREKGLNILHDYCEKGVFPVNLYHSERTPYFIDHLGTACAVGQIVIETGYGEFAEQIRKENNYGYIFDLNNKYQLLTEWAYTYGFTIKELAWIQPTYGGGGTCTMSNFGYSVNPSCAGICDGSVVLQYPMGGTPPYTISGPSCTALCAGNYTYVITDVNGNSYVQTYSIIDPPPVVASAAWVADESAPGNCDGSATSSVSGGTAPYTFNWFTCSGSPIGITSPNANGLCAGSYSVEITDANGCSDMSDCITISSGCGMVSTYSTTDVLCYGDCNGSVTITTTGGTPPYTVADPMGGITTYTSTVTVSNLCAGNYTLIIEDSSGCQEFIMITIEEPPVLAINNIVVTQDAGGCTGAVNFNVTGGTPPYSFYDGLGVTPFPFNNLCSGTSVQPCAVDGNGCTACGPVTTVTGPCNMTSGVTNTSNTSCFGSCDGTASIFTTNGNPPYVITGPFLTNPVTYTSVVTVSGICAGTWTYTITDAVSCTNYVVVTVTQPTEIIATATWISDPSGPGTCDGDASGSYTGGVNPATVQWIDCSNGNSIGTSPNISTLCDGDYAFVVTDSNGCSDTSSCITMSEPTGINENTNDFSYTIFPNPTNGIINLLLSGTKGNSIVSLTDISGKTVFSSVTGNNLFIDLNSMNLKSGCYFMRIENGNNFKVEKIIFVR